MVRRGEIRPGEVAVEAPPPTDAGLVFIGRIHTPWTDRLECPRQGRLTACRLRPASLTRCSMVASPAAGSRRYSWPVKSIRSMPCSPASTGAAWPRPLRL